MPQDSSARPSQGFPVGTALGAALVAAVAAASLLGLLAAWSGRFNFSGTAASLGLAFLSLGPIFFYALTLERGKAAPALRTLLTPWILFAALHLGVQLSGGLLSPLWPAYALLTLLVVRHSLWLNALGVALAVTVLEGSPLWQHAQQNGGALWPQALALAWPFLGLGLGLLLRDREEPVPRPTAQRPREEAVSAAPVQSHTAPTAEDLPLEEPGGSLDAATLLQRDLRASLDLAFHAFAGWNALTLWWGSSQGVRLQHLRLRQGQAAEEAEVAPGQGHLGLVLREQRLLNIEPLAASAAAGLPYVKGAYAVRSLRVLPLSDEGRLIGLLTCDKVEAPFDTTEIGALDALGRLLVQHAQRAAFLARLSAKDGRTQRLYEATKALGADLEREALLQRFGELLQTLVPCDSYALGMREEEGAALQRLASQGYAADAPRDLSVDRSAALAATLAHAEGAVLFNNVEGAQVPAVLQEGLQALAQHFLLAPLRVGGRLSGVLKLDRHQAPFSEEERDAAFIFASQAAGVLENARLYTLHKRLATTDGLTGLYNHRYFQERLAVELQHAERTGRPLALALTDIDHFKKFNDTFGHQEGDVVLRKVAQLLQQHSRPGKDIVCRYGGEEFVIIQPDCDLVESRQVMDALRAHCAEFLIGGTGPQATAITLSIGLSSYPQAAKEQRELIHAADESLYKAKRSGRNQVCSFKDL